jgi:hypothetical protein
LVLPISTLDKNRIDAKRFTMAKEGNYLMIKGIILKTNKKPIAFMKILGTLRTLLCHKQ